MAPMTLDQLRIFVAVAELEHVTRASTTLNMTQSAVSSAISVMESRHGVTMFHRVGRGIQLSAEGAEFLPVAKAILAQVRTAGAVRGDLAGLRRGSVSIFASQTIANSWLPSRLVVFNQSHPLVKLNIQIGNTAECADAVQNGTAETGLIEGRIDQQAFAVSLVARDRLIIVVGAEHPWATVPPNLPEDLGKTKWVMREHGSGTRSSFERALASYDTMLSEVSIAMELPSNEAICEAVAAGTLAAVVSETVALGKLQAGTLFQIDFDLGTREFRLIRHRERPLSAAATMFSALLSQGANTVALC